MPDLRAVPASGAACSAVTWRGLPGTNTKPANAAGRAARRSAPRFSPQNLVRPKTSSRAACGRFAGPHQRGTDEESVHAAGEPIDVAAADNAGFGNEQAVGSKAGEPLGGGEVDREIAQVAVIDADQRRSERQRAPHLAFVMNLDQHIHAEAPRFLDHGARCVVVQQRQHDENGVGTGDPGLDDLAPIDEEVLGKDRSVELVAGRLRDRRAIRRRMRRR